MEMIRGPLGFVIPVQNQKQSTSLSFTPEGVLSWRNHLPMADTGKTANQVFHALNDCNQVILSPKERYQILELFRTPVQFICQSLRKHYINQTAPLTETQLTIAHLAETLQLEMAFGYKLVLEQGDKERDREFADTILPTAIERLFHYYDHILLRSYHLYSQPSEAIWREVHLLFDYALNKNYLKNLKILNAYKVIMLMSVTDPYRWRQNEQDTLHEACTVWVTEIELRKIHSEPIIPTTEAEIRPLSAPEKMRFLELTKLIARIKQVIKTLEPNELQAKILHSTEPEYLVPMSVLQSIVHTWEKKPERSLRTERNVDVEICAGLSACHYYLNGEKPFTQQGNTSESESSSTIALAEAIDLTSMPVDLSNAENVKQFPLYSCIMVNESEHGSGAGLVWHDNVYPPLQPGELIGIRPKSEDNKSTFSIAMVRWMRHPSAKELTLGAQRLASSAKASALQLVKEGQNSGYFLRCLILDKEIVTPILPFKAGTIALLADDINSIPVKIELKTLTQSSSSYKIFEFTLLEKETEHKKIEKPVDTVSATGTTTIAETQKKPDDPGFDAIWSKL